MADIKLKICGLRENIEEVFALRPACAGFIFYKKSPRYVGESFEMPILNEGVKKVGVFVNESIEKVIQIVGQYKLNFAQLHGNENAKYCNQLMNEGIGIIKAFQMDENFDFERLREYESVIDYFLFDAKTKAFGGSGKTFNWELLNKYSMGKEYFLSGGISLENIEEVKQIDLSKVHALDVNSRFEFRPGMKDLGKLEKLIERIEELNRVLAASN